MPAIFLRSLALLRRHERAMTPAVLDTVRVVPRDVGAIGVLRLAADRAYLTRTLIGLSLVLLSFGCDVLQDFFSASLSMQALVASLDSAAHEAHGNVVGNVWYIGDRANIEGNPSSSTAVSCACESDANHCFTFPR
eukprot:c7565_g1_i1.p1 GENE.c7565_g1_i1~~c7565_g1_i1.p1  ORF type:complete len:136 (-),score=14.26 c7565_g1_i1:696-1103(-)